MANKVVKEYKVAKLGERIIVGVLAACALVTLATTAGILYVLLSEAIAFFRVVSFWDFVTDTQWTPLFAQKHFGILPLLTGTLLTTLVALAVAMPLGICVAVYLSEYADRRVRAWVKPALEILAAVPTVVYGFFALTVVTPFLQGFIPGLSGFNALSPGIVMGIMIIPYISSLSEDALHSVPKNLREGSFGLGATRFQTTFSVVIPAARSGILVSVILAVSRAVGETMIVAIAAGQQPRLTMNPLVPIETITTYIVQVSMGDVVRDSIEYQTIFAAGITLFMFTLVLNLIGDRIRRSFGKAY